MYRRSHNDELLGPYVLGALDPDEEREMERHLKVCSGCRKEVEELRCVHRILSGIPRDIMVTAPPPGLKSSVLQSCSSTNPRNR